jgi:hypothetical protein
MNRMRIGGLAAGMFVVGLLTGLAGTAVAREGTSAADCTAGMTEHMAGQDPAGIMGGSMMGEPGSSTGPGMMGPGASGMPGAPEMMGPGAQHEQHHRQTSPEVTE